jgi:HEAT repeat protein
MISLSGAAAAPVPGFVLGAAAAPGRVGVIASADPGAWALAAAILVLLCSVIAFATLAGILRYRNRRKEREWSARERKWERAVLEALSGAASAESVWGLVEPDEGLYLVDYLLRFARRTRGATRDRIAALAAPYLPAVAERLSGGDAERRARAVETVALLGFDRYADRVLAALADPSPLVSMIAARSIARRQRVEDVQPLLAHASRLTDWSPRQVTAVLASMGSEAMPALRRVMVDPDLSAGLRATAADALRQLHDPGALDAATIVLASCGEREVVAATLRLVAELGQPEHACHVRPLCEHPDPVIRAAALQALTRTGTPDDHDLLRRGVDDESGWVAIQAARGLRRTGSGESLRALAHADDPRSSLARQVLLERA